MNISKKRNIKIKKLLSILGLVLCPFLTYSQATLNTSGGSQALSTGTFDYAIGEMTLVSTKTNGTLTVTQGLLQAEDPSLGISENLFTDHNLKLYPNPVKNRLHIQPALDMAGELTVELFDMQGRRVLQERFKLQSGLEHQELNLSTLQDATYILEVQFNHGARNYRQTYNIIKSGQR